MDIKPANPLAKHFRQPAIYFKLPSKGRYWPEGTLELPLNSEIPVFPMTNSDEITLKTPDALLNGSGIVSVIQSCCPNILDAWKMPSIDVDAVLLSIRIASYGQKMSTNSKCPKCGEEHDYDIDLTVINQAVSCPNYDKTVDHNGLRIKLRPQPYISVTQSNIIQFEESKIAQNLNDPAVDDDTRNTRLKESMVRLLELNDRLLVDSTEYVETDDGQRVTETEYIKDFYKNSDGIFVRKIEERLKEIAEEGALPPAKLKCTACGHEYSIPLEFDYARFFETGS